MIASHPDLFSWLLTAVAVLAHLAQAKYSPIRFRTSGEAGWFDLKDDYNRDDIVMFKTFVAIKWTAIGSIITLQIVT
jgi:hypothetical protein